MLFGLMYLLRGFNEEDRSNIIPSFEFRAQLGFGSNDFTKMYDKFGRNFVYLTIEIGFAACEKRLIVE